ncbi:MAG: acyl carrier protein [Gemmiger sp.]
MTFGELQEILEEQFSCDEGTVNEDTSLADDLGADELDLTELAWQISETTDLNISEEDIENFETVGELWQFIRDAEEQRDE